MKKIILFCLVLCILLTGCNKKEEKKVEDVKDNVITLSGNPTTGYQWICEASDEIIEVKSTYEQDVKDENVSGAGGTYTFTLNGIKEGKTTLKCTYKRSWEETEFDEEKEYDITVDKDLKVSYEEKK